MMRRCINLPGSSLWRRQARQRLQRVDAECIRSRLGFEDGPFWFTGTGRQAQFNPYSSVEPLFVTDLNSSIFDLNFFRLKPSKIAAFGEKWPFIDLIKIRGPCPERNR
jgi:hypothetical protein